MSVEAARLLELAERCEMASGPDRGLDGDIAPAVGAVPSWAIKRPSPQRQPELFSDGGVGLRARTWLADRYTSSLDDAMTLVPEGAHYTIEPDSVWVRWMGRCDVEEAQGHLHGRGGKCTPLALCSAALRARASLLTKDDDCGK